MSQWQSIKPIKNLQQALTAIASGAILTCGCLSMANAQASATGQSEPSTGLQAPLPAPIGNIPAAGRPILLSPTLKQLAPGLADQPITINDAVAIALSTNRSLALAGEALLRAQGRVSETKSSFNPTLGGTASYTRLDKSNSANIGGKSVIFTNADQPQLSISATLPIDISGQLRAATDQARFQEIAARLDINRARNQIVLDVKSAFYDVLRAQALVGVATENLQNSQDRLDDSNKKFKAGVVARFDVIRAETDVLNGRQNLIQARSQVSLAIASLNSAMGIDINTPLQVSDKDSVETPTGMTNALVPLNPVNPGGIANQPFKESVLNPMPLKLAFDPLELGPQYDVISREAFSTRPEILEADASIAAAKKGIIIARRGQMPTLGVSVGGVYNPNAAGFTPITTTGQANISLNIPFYDGGLARARVREARADVSTAETNRRQTVDLVALEVRQAFLLLVQARDRVSVADQGLVQAQEGFRLARVRYNAGVAAQAGISPLLEVSDAQAALTLAESNRVNALYDYNNSRARLDKAAGRYSYMSQAPGFAKPPVIK